MEQSLTLLSTYFEIDQPSIEKIADLFQVERLEKDQPHIREGQYNAPLSFVLSGVLRISKSQNGKEITQYLVTEGEVATELGSLLFNKGSRWQIQAIAETQLLTISNTNYHKLPAFLPDWMMYEKQFIAKCFMFLEDRVFSFLSMTAEERFDFLHQMKPQLFKEAPQQYIASMLGITPETFSRIRKKKLS